MKLNILVAALGLTVSTLVFADTPAAKPSQGAAGSCEQIVAACKSAGFVEGEYQKGYGLHIDCIDPIMRGTKEPAKADKPLPSVAPAVVAACKLKHPDFGEGKKSQAK